MVEVVEEVLFGQKQKLHYFTALPFGVAHNTRGFESIIMMLTILFLFAQRTGRNV
ncbi:hypothetical protein [Robertmurraya sp.]|uniref:hypothetical protein n=1 Tax=Robertmurraya sp. TaxID=2837525 RepID=UPI0037039EC7